VTKKFRIYTARTNFLDYLIPQSSDNTHSRTPRYDEPRLFRCEIKEIEPDSTISLPPPPYSRTQVSQRCMVFLAVSAILALNKRALERLWLVHRGFFNITGLNFLARERVSRSIEPTTQQDNHQWEQYCDIPYSTCYRRFGNINTDRKADGARPASMIMASHHWRAPAVDFPPSATPRVHHTSVLDSPVPPIPVHELSKIFSAINLQSTTEDESASKPDLLSPLKFRQRPGPRKRESLKLHDGFRVLQQHLP